MALTHVSTWSKEKAKWIHITTSDAIKLYGHRTISSDEEKLRCDLCGHFVTMACGYIYDPYFKHNKEDNNKRCEERSTGSNFTYYATALKQYISLQMACDPRTGVPDFRFELIIPSITSDEFDKAGADDIISINLPNKQNLVYNVKKRITPDTNSILSVGNDPENLIGRICLSVQSNIEKLRKMQQMPVMSLFENGTVFNIRGKMLFPGSDIHVGEECYLLTRHSVPKERHVSVLHVKSRTFSYQTWSLYRVSANTYDDDAARFFGRYLINLTKMPATLKILWPPCAVRDEDIYTNADALFLLQSGEEVTTKMFPNPRGFDVGILKNCELPSGDALLIGRLDSSEHDIVMGRHNALQCFHIHQFSSNKIVEKPYQVKTIQIDSGMTFSCKVTYNGFAETRESGRVIQKTDLNAGSEARFSLLPGQEIYIYQGMDLYTVYCRKKDIGGETLHEATEMTQMYERLSACRSKEIPVPHAYGAVAERYRSDPKTRQWIIAHVRMGRMPQEAVRILEQEIYRIQ